MARDNEQFSSDFPGAVRDYLHGGSAGAGACGARGPGAGVGEREPIAAFFQAASGNICQCIFGLGMFPTRFLGDIDQILRGSLHYAGQGMLCAVSCIVPMSAAC